MTDYKDHQQALAEKDALIERLRASSWDENVRLIAESKENLLQQYCNLQILYGEQKHKIRDLEKSYQQLMEQLDEATSIMQSARMVGEIYFRTCALSRQVHDQIEAFLKEREGK